MYGLRSMKYHNEYHYGTISLSVFAFHNLIHYLELNLKLILLTNIDLLYPISLCSFFLKNQLLRLQRPSAISNAGGGAFSRLVYLC